jgi:hypothetical protein
MISLLISLIILCVIAGIAYWILTQIPGIPPIVPKLVWLANNYTSFGAVHLTR